MTETGRIIGGKIMRKFEIAAFRTCRYAER